MKYYWYQVGTGDFLHSFFSTIAHNIENGVWGTRFPVIMKELYSGKVSVEHLDEALQEVRTITEELRKCSVDKAIWDIDDLSIPMPWGDNISPDITDLSNYFVTSDGEDLITILSHAIEKAMELKTDLRITSL